MQEAKSYDRIGGPESADELEGMDRLFDRLFPITRSIAGPGVRDTLAILNEHVPLEIIGVPSGTRVFDWVVPREWHIEEAWIKDAEGRTIVDFRDHNLHVVNFSTAVDRVMSLEELRPHLYTVPHLPDAIPYVTSYYKERWGFCLSQRQLDELRPGLYHVRIRSEHVDGELNIGQAVLPGESEEEVLISTYICHPSMANNELSGPIVAAFLYNRLKNWPARRFTYRFVWLPETIGSITYLYLHGDELKRKLVAGLVLTCLGGDHVLHYKKSRRGDAPLDRLIEHLFRQTIPGRTVPFTPIHGSDERQYNSPGFNLPVGQLNRTLTPGFAGYHTSLDTKESMGIDRLYQSLNEIESILQAFEHDGYYINTRPFGEVKLDKYGLYPDINSRTTTRHSSNELADGRKQLNRILTILNYADGEHSLHDIADKCGASLPELVPLVQKLKGLGLLRGPYSRPRGLFE